MSKRWRWIAAVAGGLLFVAIVAFYGLAWHYSNVLDEEALDADEKHQALTEREFDDTTVLAIPPGWIVLTASIEPDAEVSREGRWGIAWPDGYGIVDEMVDADSPDGIIRRFTLVEGDDPAPGTPAELDRKVVPPDGGEFFQSNSTIVDVPGPLGAYESRFVEASGNTWALLVSGNGLDWRDLAHLAPALNEAGYPVLLVTYRNMPGAPEDPSGRLTYGEHEWEDLDAAVRYALKNGAGDVVLIGASMGGGVIMSLFVNAPESAAAVRAVVLDAPMLSFRRAVEFQAAQVDLPLIGVGLPGALTDTARWLATQRFDVDWDATDYIDDGGRLTAPALIFHGDADDDVPIATSREFATANPANVTLVEVPGAGHVQSWNVDPGSYESRLLAFLDAEEE